MKETPHKRSGDGGTIGRLHEPRADACQTGKNTATSASTAPVQEDAPSARRAVTFSRCEIGGQAASLPMTPPPEARTDWPRGTGELGTEGMDPSQPLNQEPTPTCRLASD